MSVETTQECKGFDSAVEWGVIGSEEAVLPPSTQQCVTLQDHARYQGAAAYSGPAAVPEDTVPLGVRPEQATAETPERGNATAEPEAVGSARGVALVTRQLPLIGNNPIGVKFCTSGFCALPPLLPPLKSEVW